MGGVITPLFLALNIILNVIFKSIFCFYSDICFICTLIYFEPHNCKILSLRSNFPFGLLFQIFVTVVNFKENYFKFKKYTISNFLMCLNVAILLQAPRKLKKSIAAFLMKMTFKVAIFLCSAKDALLGISPGHWLLGSKYMKKSFSISRQYLMGAVVKYSYHLLFWRGTVSLAFLNTSIFHWKKSPN